MELLEDRSKKILIVEDEGLIAADVQQKLERLGYGLAAIAQSGVEAIRCARSTRFDLVLMDIRLKGEMDGIATARALKTEFEVPVVYMTAHADQETINRATPTEPLGYMMKPITDAALRSVVQISLYRHQMERRLRISEARLSTTLRSIGDDIIDLAGRLPGYCVGPTPATAETTRPHKLVPRVPVAFTPGIRTSAAGGAPTRADAAPPANSRRGGLSVVTRLPQKSTH
jgi:CheY-like chemotaxis protein